MTFDFQTETLPIFQRAIFARNLVAANVTCWSKPWFRISFRFHPSSWNNCGS